VHLLYNAFAIEYGCSANYAKQTVFKEMVLPDVFVYHKENKFGVIIKEVRSTKDIPKEQMTKCISKFKEWSGMQGIYLPDAENKEEIRSLEIMIDRMQDYL
jgi:phosphopantetheine adenylyltransferase